jgi:copper chaperone CopZ
LFEYVHAINGRLRVKVPEVKRSTAFAWRVEDLFRSVDGIQLVRANPVTGTVLFLHDPKRIQLREILAGLVAAGYMGMGITDAEKPVRADRLGELAATIAELVCWGLSRAVRNFTPNARWLEGLLAAATRFLVKLALAG